MGQPIRHEYSAVIPGRDELHLTLNLRGDEIVSAQLRAIGCPELLRACQEWRPRLTGSVAALPVPEGSGHDAILLREVLAKAKGEWDFPYKEEELCHCRVVALAKVDAAVVCGAHAVAVVSRRTSAGTSCGTCQPDVQKVIDYRLNKTG